MCAYVYVNVYVCESMCMYVCMSVCVYMYVCMGMCVCSFIGMQLYVHVLEARHDIRCHPQSHCTLSLEIGPP